MGLLYKLGELRPKRKGSVGGPTSVGVIIRDAPSIGGVEHKVSSRSTCLLDGEVHKCGGGRVDKVSPKCDKHVPHIIGCEVHTINGDGLGANIAKVWGVEEGPIGIKEEQLRLWVNGMGGLLKKCEGSEKGR